MGNPFMMCVCPSIGGDPRLLCVATDRGHWVTCDSPGSACHRINETFTLVISFEWNNEDFLKHGVVESFDPDYTGQYDPLGTLSIQWVS